MMYLENEEVQGLVEHELGWIREGGYLFARESCHQQSGKYYTHLLLHTPFV